MKARISENERMNDSEPQVAEGFAVCECGFQREPERSRERARGPVDGETTEERERTSARAYVAVLEPIAYMLATDKCPGVVLPLQLLASPMPPQRRGQRRGRAARRRGRAGALSLEMSVNGGSDFSASGVPYINFLVFVTQQLSAALLRVHQGDAKRGAAGDVADAGSDAPPRARTAARHG